MNKATAINKDEIIQQLLESKKQMLNEIKNDFATPGFQKALEELRLLNKKSNAV
jgi:hypothetical protein